RSYTNSLTRQTLLTTHFYFYSTTAPPNHTYTLSLHDALPILPENSDIRGVTGHGRDLHRIGVGLAPGESGAVAGHRDRAIETGRDRKSTRLNSSHDQISYAVFCLKKKINWSVNYHCSATVENL